MRRAYGDRPMVQMLIYLATVAFLVLGVFVFVVALFLGRAALTLASPFLTAALTLVATLLSFLGAVFLVTPVGFTPAFLAAGFLLMVGAVSTCWKTRGWELPVADRVPSRAIATDLF